jgi:ABC-type sugar transport system ATPase subunit
MDQIFKLEMKNISKSFPGVKALDGVNFDLKPGEIHAILGENGAGKSTLIKILAGAYSMDKGEIYIDGEIVNITNPQDAYNSRIGVVYQELSLINEISVAENMFLGHLPIRGHSHFVKWKALEASANAKLKTLAEDIESRMLVASLTMAQKQVVEIAKALMMDPTILVMDEPTAALTENETESLFSILRNLVSKGVSIIYISHRVSELLQLADRITVLRDGMKVETVEKDSTSQEKLITMMVNRSLQSMYPKKLFAIGEEVLAVQGLCTDKLKKVSFCLKKREILGVFGLMGAGQSDLARAMVGEEEITDGEIILFGKGQVLRSAVDAKEYGIGLVPLDRKEQGLNLLMDVKSNITLSSLARYSKGHFMMKRKEIEGGRSWIKQLNIRPSNPFQLVKSLSGGNQQKVVLARLLEAQVKILILNYPTRGVDVGAKVEIYTIMEKFCEDGGSIVMISPELPEVMGICDRILVLSDGSVTGCFDRQEAEPEKIMACAVARVKV